MACQMLWLLFTKSNCKFYVTPTRQVDTHCGYTLLAAGTRIFLLAGLCSALLCVVAEMCPESSTISILPLKIMEFIWPKKS